MIAKWDTVPGSYLTPESLSMGNGTDAAPAGIRLNSLDAWVSEHVAELEPPISASVVSGGRSNLTYCITDRAGGRTILRRPPAGRLQGTAHDVTREWRILRALEATPLPIARPLAHCDDPEVIGAPFFVMAFADGETLDSPDAARRLDAAAKRRVGEQVPEVLADLHALDPVAIGLGDLVRPGAYIERQLRRWSRQIDDYESHASDLIRPVHDALARHRPREQRQVLLHGDYKLANLRVDATGAIRAVLDWELSAIGDPLADLGWLLASWAEPADAGRWIVEPPTTVEGFTDRGSLVAAYAARSGLDLGDIDYYVAFSYWRWSCINEGIRHRFASDVMGGRTIDLAAVEEQIRWQLERAWTLLGSSVGVP